MPNHPVVGGSVPTVVKRPGEFTLPEWWGLLEDNRNKPGVINYGDIQFPLSNAIAPDLYLTIAYGQVRIGGIDIGFGSVPGAETYHGWGIVAWCEGEIESIDNFYVDGQLRPPATLNFGTRGVAHYTGTGSQYTQDNSGDLFCPFPRTNPGIGSLGPYETTALKTAAYTRLDLNVNIPTAGLYPWWATLSATSAGPYEWAADVHGLKLYDPRTTLTVYSNNPALIVRDLFKRVAKLTDAELDDASFIAAANACDTAGFTCNVAFATRTTLGDALAVVLQTCNGFVVNSQGKVGLFLDVVNAGAAVATLSEAEGDIWGIDYEWLSVRDRYTAVAVSFLNKDADYKQDMTRFREDPGIALGTVPNKPAVLNAPGINTVAAANKLRDYSYNVQTIAFRLKGTMNASGILLSQGSKVRIQTLKGVDADFLIIQITGNAQGFFSLVAKPYSAAVYSSVPQIVNPPVVNPPGVDPDAPPPPAAPRHQTGMPPSGTNQGVAFDAPRVYTESGPYGIGNWTISGTGASGDTSKLNDGVTNVVAATTTDSIVLALDRGIVVPEVFGRVNFWIDADLATFFQYGILEVLYSDDDITYTDALTSGAGYGKTTAWQDAPVAGIYPCHVEIPDSIGAHRYWKFNLFGIAAGLGTINIYEVEWETFTAYTGAIVGYNIRTWPGGSYDGAFPADLNSYDAPAANAPAVFTLATLPTDGSPFSPVDVGPLFSVDGDIVTTQASTFRAAFTTIGAVKGSGTAVPGSLREVVAAAHSFIETINGDDTPDQLLIAGTNITITDDGIGGHTIDASGAGGGGPDFAFMLMGA